MLRKLPDLAPWRLAALSPEFQSLEGTLLDDRFRVGPILARGGFALVADGHDESQGNRRCAIKVFYHDAVDREWTGHRFRHEVRALEQMHHPNVVGIYGSGVAPNGSFYLVMEFIEGMTLRTLIDQGPIPPRQIAHYLRQMGSALDAVHQRGIYHRDVKPENLMLRQAAAPGMDLVLIDFSIAIVKDPDKTVHGLSRAAGTIGYMAPEQAVGFADPATDIYSLAKVLIEMITGTRLAMLLPDASMDLPARIRDLIPTLLVRLSPASIQLFSSAFEFDPARRPANAEEFASRIADDLESD
jgi:serine/threonine-protein kinase